MLVLLNFVAWNFAYNRLVLNRLRKNSRYAYENE